MAKKPYDVEKLLGLKREQLPVHIAIIMDGNGRWARRNSMPRIEGHRRGAQVVRQIVAECADLGIKYLTLYSFSMENWKRPREEVDLLMLLFAEYLAGERPRLMDKNTRLVHVGQQRGLPQFVADRLNETARLTADNTGMTLALALNYSARVEIIDAVGRIAKRVSAGQIDPEEIDEDLISQNLYTAGIPDPDLLIRTAGERRLSNFLLWQLSYSEFYVARVFWPEFTKVHLRRAIQSYAARDRRFGAIDAKGGTDPS